MNTIQRSEISGFRHRLGDLYALIKDNQNDQNQLLCSLREYLSSTVSAINKEVGTIETKVGSQTPQKRKNI